MNNSRGFGMVEVLVLFAILSVPIMAAMSLNSFIASQNAKIAETGGIEVFKQSLTDLISDDGAWLNTVNGNQPSMSCLRPNQGQTCTLGQPVSFNLFDRSTPPQLFYAAATPTTGINNLGTICNSYPSADCPFRYELQWAAMNQDPYAIVGVLIRLRSSAYAKLKLNPKFFSLVPPDDYVWTNPRNPNEWPDGMIFRHVK